MSDLDSFLSAVSTEPAPAAEPAPAVEVPAAPVVASEGETTGAPPAPELPPRDERGRWVKSEEPAPVAAPPSNPHTVPLEALLAEREKRQAAERAMEEARRNQPKPDFWENPDAAIDAKLKDAQARLLEEADIRAEARARELFLKHAEGMARSRHNDYDQMRQVFAEEASRNPILASQLREAADPAEFIYRQGKTAAELREVGGDLEAYKQRLIAEVRAQALREFTATQAPKPAPQVPQSLNTEPSKGAGIAGAAWSGPTPLEDIIPRRI